jgi:hypothetical protein
MGVAKETVVRGPLSVVRCPLSVIGCRLSARSSVLYPIDQDTERSFELVAGFEARVIMGNEVQGRANVELGFQFEG